MIDWLDLPKGPFMPISGTFFMRGMKPEPPREPEPELPEFAFSPREVRAQAPDPRFFLARGRQRPLTLLPGYGPSLPLRVAAKFRRAHEGTADRVWGTNFSLKFSKAPDPDALPVPAPVGAGKVIAEFVDRVTELQHYVETACCVYHAKGGLRAEHQGIVRDLETTRDEMRRARIDNASLDTSSEVAMQLAETDVSTIHYAVILSGSRDTDDLVVGDAKYIAAMSRRIEWEQFRSQCGPLLRAYFERDADGDLAIVTPSRRRDRVPPEALSDLRSHVLRTWKAQHAALPHPDAVMAARARLEGTRIIAELDPDQRDAFEASRNWSDEDEDPGRVPLHADPDPKPQRWQYPYGDCRYCAFPDDPDEEAIHLLCTKDGDELFSLDLTVWEHEQLRLGEVGYAGPSGALGHDDAALDAGIE